MHKFFFGLTEVLHKQHHYIQFQYNHIDQEKDNILRLYKQDYTELLYSWHPSKKK